MYVLIMYVFQSHPSLSMLGCSLRNHTHNISYKKWISICVHILSINSMSLFYDFNAYVLYSLRKLKNYFWSWGGRSAGEVFTKQVWDWVWSSAATGKARYSEACNVTAGDAGAGGSLRLSGRPAYLMGEPQTPGRESQKKKGQHRGWLRNTLTLTSEVIFVLGVVVHPYTQHSGAFRVAGLRVLPSEKTVSKSKTRGCDRGSRCQTPCLKFDPQPPSTRREERTNSQELPPDLHTSLPLSLAPALIKPGMVVYAFNTSEAAGLRWGQTGLHSETLSQQTKNKQM